MKTRRTPEERKQLRQKPKELKQRKHVKKEERPHFLEATALLEPKRRMFCELIYYTGCRIQEAHDICPYDFKTSTSLVAFECLKIREEGVFRYVPVPPYWIKEAAEILQINRMDPYECVWDFSLRTGARAMKKVMEAAGIEGPYANARGLRHSFCTIHGHSSNTRTDQLQYWAGHKNASTTFIYIAAPDTHDCDEHEVAKICW